MRTTVDIDTHLLKKLRADAERRGVSFKDALAGALRRGLDESVKAAPLKPYVCPTYRMGALINLDKALSLADELDDEETIRKMRVFEASVKR